MQRAYGFHISQVAREHDEMEVYSDALGSTATQEDNSKIAAYYESKNKPGQVLRVIVVQISMCVTTACPKRTGAAATWSVQVMRARQGDLIGVTRARQRLSFECVRILRFGNYW